MAKHHNKGKTQSTALTTKSSSSGSKSSSSSGSKSYGGKSYHGGYSSQSPKPAFEFQGIQFWGSARTKLDEIYLDENDLIINCSGTAATFKPFIKNCPDWLDLPATADSKPHQVLFDWKDFSPPPSSIGLPFWKKIFDQAKEHGIKRIVCCCGAGQGRTGTALSALALATGFIDEPEDAIDYIRATYTHKAVETKGQELYLWTLIYTMEEIFADEEEEDDDASSDDTKNDSKDEDTEEDEGAWDSWTRNYGVS